MLLQELFNQRTKDSASYKAVTADDVEITDEELETLKREFLRKKISAINSENYARAVNTEPVYKMPSFKDLHDALILEMTERYGWDIDEWNEFQLKQIACYFSGEKEFELMGDGFSQKKGLLLFGPVGCGKTTVLKVLQKNSFNPFRFVSCRKVADEFAIMGHNAISEYSQNIQVSRREWYGHNSISLCFDDLGTESEKKNFGNQVNVMAEIILNRYDNIEQKNKTMITTNLSADDMRDYYGARAVSRMREMFNIIEFPFDGPDRRK